LEGVFGSRRKSVGSRKAFPAAAGSLQQVEGRFRQLPEICGNYRYKFLNPVKDENN
jgi:hypothetical protein